MKMSLNINVGKPTSEGWVTSSIINMDHIVIINKISKDYKCILSTGQQLPLDEASVERYKNYMTAKENHYKSK